MYGGGGGGGVQASSHLHAFLPADPEVAPGQEADHRSPAEGADPALLLQLHHDGVDPGEAGPTLGPLGQGLGVLVPGDLKAHGVALHPVEVEVFAGGRVEELPEGQAGEVQEQTAALLHLVGWMKKQVGSRLTK